MGHEQKGVLHDEVGLLEELLQLTQFVGLLGDVIKGEPRSSKLLRNGRILVEIALDDLFDLVYPSLLEVVADLRDGALLDLVELVDLHGFGDVRVVDVLGPDIVALLADLLHGSDRLVLVQDGVEIELVERVREVVLRDLDHALLRSRPLDSLLRQVQRVNDQVAFGLLHVLVEDDLVHRLGKLKVDLREQSSGVRAALASQCLAVLSLTQDPVDLLIVNLRDLMSSTAHLSLAGVVDAAGLVEVDHVLDVEVVLEQRVGDSSGLVSLLEPLSKLPGILVVKQDVYSGKPDFLLGAFPVAFVPLRLEEVPLDSKLSPDAEPVSVLPISFGANFSELSSLGTWDTHGHGLFSSRSVRVLLGDHEPAGGRLGVHVLVVVGFERQPASRSQLGVAELNVLKEIVNNSLDGTYRVEKQLLNAVLREVFFGLFDHLLLLLLGLIRLLLLLLRWRLIPVRIEARDRRSWGLALKHI